MRYPPQLKTSWHHALQSLGLLFWDPYLLNIVLSLGYYVVGMEKDVLRETSVSLLSRKMSEGKKEKENPSFHFLKNLFCMYLLLYESIYFVWRWWRTYHNMCAEARGSLAGVISLLLPSSSQEPNSGDHTLLTGPSHQHQDFISHCMKTKKCEWAKSQVYNRTRITTSTMTLQNYTTGSGQRC